ncbi:sigma 54-interacting transcriptional regulator [Hyalangium rubrum]|uniref:Sigma 54-interacting transcriptional regulator n=1 Tax=Hyalangium rubrum TaxID=3103134 RepID=A0ABU5HDW6_9BACT|nr:sigma 54-interacting transcriptional regulator [Hyalangium sp. s54d21]MDY7230998.1 sigma 54-interacting transcriptional regulator [Hyalangium sp. s54d21]
MNVRVVAATNRELLLHARQGKFREGLYYRLGVMPLVLPLCNRPRAPRLLAEHFVRAHAPRAQAVKFTPAALARLEQHSWPGNIRAPEDTAAPALELPEGVTPPVVCALFAHGFRHCSLSCCIPPRTPRPTRRRTSSPRRWISSMGRRVARGAPQAMAEEPRRAGLGGGAGGIRTRNHSR